ncbi:hypothetical protein PORY_001331 [Pneumocystis oryctolagi]|uniref:Uncharacterized protein n=1 Tax=Pneumocystis oryctolagi TaxID=42067 RepID=A0ACB7CBP1_9ASCO|nr:hypothetical protein PORY_001331 [Pneumocystis oryctolagi]
MNINDSLQDILRMIVIVGGYLLLRPYLQRWVRRKQTMDYERKDKKAECEIEEEDAFVWGSACRLREKKKEINVEK